MNSEWHYSLRSFFLDLIESTRKLKHFSLAASAAVDFELNFFSLMHPVPFQ